MAAFQNILSALSGNKNTQAREERKLQSSIEEQPQMRKQFERVERAEKKLAKGKGGIDFENPWSKYFVKKSEFVIPEGKKSAEATAMTVSDLKKQGIRQNAKDIESMYMPSSAIQKIRYNPKTKNLYIKFTSGDKEYLYPNVPESEIRKYLVADSKGRYNYHKIRPKYAVSKEEALRIKQESRNR